METGGNAFTLIVGLPSHMTLLNSSYSNLDLFTTLLQVTPFPCAQWLTSWPVHIIHPKDDLYVACYTVPGILPSEHRFDDVFRTYHANLPYVIHDPRTVGPVLGPVLSCGGRIRNIRHRSANGSGRYQAPHASFQSTVSRAWWTPKSSDLSSPHGSVIDFKRCYIPPHTMWHRLTKTII